MPSKSRTQASASRDVRGESGKPTFIKKKKAPKRAPSPSSSSEDEIYENSDLESELEMNQKVDQARPSKKVEPRQKTRTADNLPKGDEESGSELAQKKKKETESKIAPHLALLLSAGYYLSFQGLTQPSFSFWIPSAMNMFYVLQSMADSLSANLLVNEMVPEYVSIVLYMYYGYVYYYQILRARDYVGQSVLSRSERRVLRKLESFGKPQSWPIASPLIEFVRALGAYKPSNAEYDWVVPKFIDVTSFGAVAADGQAQTGGLVGLANVVGSINVPLIPAMVQFVKNFGAGGHWHEDTLYPVHQTLSGLNQFLGLSTSTANSSGFQSLAFNQCWNRPAETGDEYSYVNLDVKKSTIKRWRMSDAPLNLREFENFMMTADDLNFQWFSNILKMMARLNSFFPGSTNLGAIDPVSHIGNISFVTYGKTVANAGRADVWYSERKNWSLGYSTYDDTETGRQLARSGVVISARSSLSREIHPFGDSTTNEEGPFFVDDAQAANIYRKHPFAAIGASNVDVAPRLHTMVETIYDPTAGKK